MSVHLAAIRKQYANFVPMLINSDSTRSSLKQQAFTAVNFNPESFISQQLLPASELPALLPMGYRPPVSEKLNCAVCGHAAVSPSFFACGCCVCCLCDAPPDSYCQAHSEPFGMPISVPEDVAEFLLDEIPCPFENAGCGARITLKGFEDHVNLCFYSAVRCPYCRTPGFRSNFDTHYAICPSLPCKCALCGENVQISMIGPHVEEMHPLCGYCGERRVVEKDHQVRQCFVPGCAEIIAECILKKHLKDIAYADVHCQELVDRLYFVETELKQHIDTVSTLKRENEALEHNISDTKVLKQQLRDVTRERDRIFILNYEEAPSLMLISKILTIEERVSIAFYLLQTAINKPDQLISPLNVRFDKQLKITVKPPTDQDFQLLCEQQQAYSAVDPQNKAITSFAITLNEILAPPSVLNKVETAVQSIFSQIYALVFAYKAVQRFTKLVSICFSVAFDDYISKQEAYSQVLEYFAGMLPADQEILALLQARQCKFAYDEYLLYDFVQIGRLPIAKYTALDGQQLMFSAIEQGSVQYYDYVYLQQADVAPDIIYRTFVRLLGAVAYGSAPRALVYGSPDPVRHLIPPHCFSLTISLEKTPSNSFSATASLAKIARDLQEIALLAQVYDTYQEITQASLFSEMSKAANLTYLRMSKIRVAGAASESLSYLAEAQGLRFLELDECEVCHPSYLKLNFPALFYLSLKLRSLDSRKRLYEADAALFCQQLSNCTLLENFELNLQGDFSLSQRAAQQLGTALSSAQRLQKCCVSQAGLRGDALISFLSTLYNAPRLRILSLERNPAFASDPEKAVEALMQLLQLTQLTELDLSDTRLSSRGLAEMANGRQQLGLQMLCLDKNRLTDEDCKNLARLMIKTPALTELSVRHCRDITTRGVRILIGRTGRAFRIGYENNEKIEEEMADMRFSYIDGVYVKTE